MTDEQHEEFKQAAIHDAIVEATLQGHTESVRVCGLWPLKNEAVERRVAMYRALFDQTVVLGAEMPRFELNYQTCDKGCHQRVYITDEANGEAYFISEVEIPDLGIPLTGMRLHPAVEMAELRRLQAVCN